MNNIYGTTNDLPGTNSGLPRNFILRCSKNLNTATKNNKQKKKRQQLHNSSEDYKDVFRFNCRTSLWGYPYLAGVNLHKLPKVTTTFLKPCSQSYNPQPTCK